LRNYSWDDAVEATEDVYTSLVERGRTFTSMPTHKPEQHWLRRLVHADRANENNRLTTPMRYGLTSPMT
jgi:hypothetical protein